ncbi:MAG: hypothetical protein OEY51_04405, partial [Cyclobacteriaceae bacterium]|nr:hypothetical protein [Cyclobacteriaceae bacterium]
MRNFIKLPFMFLVAGLLGLSGCIDNTVSPEVTAIRNAQAALLQAKADYQAAWVAYREAVTAAQEIANTVATANAARDIAAAQNTLEEAALKHSKEMIALQTALDAQVGSDAAQYLASYTTAVEAVYTATADKLTLEKNLADDYLLLTTLHNIDGVAGNEAQTIATIKAHYERKLAEEKVLLSYDSLVLANLLAVQTDASASDAVRASTERAIDSLDNVIWDFNNQIAIAKENDLIADELVTSINKTIADYDQLTEDIATATANIADYNAGIPVTNKYIAWYTDLLTINTGAIGSYTTLVSTTKTTFNT